MKKFLALLLCAALIITLLPAAALAAPGSTYTYGDLTLTELGDGTLSVTGYTGTGGAITIPHVYDPDPDIAGDEKEVTAVGDSVFNGAAITSLIIEEGIKTIGMSAFCDCNFIQTVTLPEGLTTIGNFAFYECGALETVVIPGTVTSIGKSAFILCSKLKNVTLGNGLSYISESMFNGCFSLETIEIPDTVETIGPGAFSSTALKTLSLPEGVTTIENFAFADCDKMESAVLPESVETVGDRAFADSLILKKATVLNTDTEFGTLVFYKTSINTDGIYGFELSTAQAYASANSHAFHTLYKVTYDSKDGSDVPFGYAVSGGTISAPDDPTRNGYIFRGWYEDETYTTPVSFPYAVSGSTTFYAKWSDINGTGTLKISSSPAGADVYVDGDFTKSVSPCTLELRAGTHKVELKIEGYETYSNENVQIFADETAVLNSIVQLPALSETDADHTITVTTLQDKVRWSDVSGMDSITVAQLKADSGTAISLREAVQAVKNEPAGNGHYRIEFAPVLKGGTISLFKPGDQKFPVEDWMLQNLYIEKRGNMTINGDIDRDGDADITLEPYTNGSPSSPKGSVLNVYASDVTLAGIIFRGDETLSYSTLIFRVPDRNTEKYDVDNVRVLGCTLDHSQGTGVATCGAYGYGGTSYGGAGTTNFTDLVFAGNTFTKTSLFSFAGAGDEDYNVIDGYYICANRFYNGCVGMLAADAHTWYVYGSNDQNGNGGVAGQAGFCEHNQLKNIYVSGNYFEHTENAGIVGATTANQGNSNNLIENMYIRNNTSVVADGLDGGVSLENASIGRDDRYTSDQLTHNTADNIMRNVYIEDNNFKIGDKSRFGIYNSQGGCVRDSHMDGTGNLIENIQVRNNRIESDLGAFITNIGGFSGVINSDVSENTMRDIVFSGNEITGVDPDWMTSGLEAANHSNIMNTHIPSYHNNTMSGITIENNTVSGYRTGIVAAGSLGNGADAHSIEDVTVSGNTVSCKANGEYGIITAGNIIDAYGGDSYNGSTNCEANGITISGNNITAPGGILLVGTYVNAPVKGSLEGNNISSVSVYNNTITKPEGSDVNRPVPGVTAADIIETWPRIEANTVLDKNSCGQPDIHDNTINGFICDVFDMSQLTSSFSAGTSKTADEILGDYKASAEAVFGGNSMDWYWYSDTFSPSAAGVFTAAGRRIGQIGFDYLYECVSVTAITELSITVQPNDASYGSVSGGGTYVTGDSVTLTATPRNGYRFVRWTEDGAEVSTNAVYTFTASCSRDITAEFSTIGTPSIITPVSYNYDRAALTWSAVEGAAGYEVWRAASAGGSYTKIIAVPDASYTNIGLKAGTTYYYKIKAYCDTGTVKTYGSLSAYASVRPVPLAPAACSASAADYDSIKVEWTKADGASGYMVYRSTSEKGTYSRIATTSRTYYTNNYVGTGTTYYYKVRAYRSYTSIYGNYSPVASAVTSLKPMENVAAVTYYPTAIKISWKAVPGRSGYEIWRSDTEGTAPSYYKTTTYTYYNNTGLSIDKLYYYQVRAYRTVNGKKVYNELSPIVKDTARVFQVKNVKAAMYSVTSNKLTWSAVPGASGYEIIFCDSEGNALAGRNNAATTYTYYYNKKLVPNETYYYKVKAYRTVGNVKRYGLESQIVSAMPVFKNVTNVKAYMYSVASNKITWSAVSGSTGYEVWRSELPDSGFAQLTPATSNWIYTYFYHKNLAGNGKTYYYKVKAYVTVGGERKYSTESAAVPAYNKMSGLKGYTYAVTKNRISWNAVSGRTGYEVWWSEYPDSGFTKLNTRTLTNNYIYHGGIDPTKTYYYKVKAYQTISGAPIYCGDSDVLQVTSKVQGAKAAMSSVTSIKVSWNAVSGCDGYEVWRSTLPDSGYVKIRPSSTAHYTYTYFTNTGLTTDQTYYYKVCAYDTVGGVKFYSGFSDVVWATPSLKAVSGARASRYNSTKIKLTWYSVSGATGYEIERCTTGVETDFVNIKTTTTTSTYYYDGGRSHGTRYYYRIRAYRKVGENTYYGGWSKVVYATP